MTRTEMAAGQRHMYETAFDSKMYRASSVEILEQLDAVTNHVMERCSPQLPYHLAPFCSSSVSQNHSSSFDRFAASRQAKGSKQAKLDSSVSCLSLPRATFDLTQSGTLLHGYSSDTSTSTIRLPTSVSSRLNDSIESFSESSHKTDLKILGQNIFTNETARHEKAKDVKSGNNNDNGSSNEVGNDGNHTDDIRRGSMNIPVQRRQPRHHQHQPHHQPEPSNSCSSKRRPRSCHLTSKIMEIKSRPKESGSSRPFSSTESMATSSSGSSLESIRSSTSDGNCSTTSTDSRRSSSISSHSSDLAVGGGGYCFSLNLPFCNRYPHHQSKMHVLSPISDKSFQEACSETSEFNRNGGADSPPSILPAESCASTSPEVDATSGHNKTKKRPPPSKIAITSAVSSASVSGVEREAHQCSDSGISMKSQSEASKTAPASHLDDLPFDIPKLRRRRLQPMQLAQGSTQDTSGSATSIDLNELPFDMPKLRRKLRTLSIQGSLEIPCEFKSEALSQMASEQKQSGDDISKRSNGSDQGRSLRPLSLSLNLNDAITAGINIDTNLPLERQGWYHGAITRMEAENELRNRDEGSYLVRNSESAKHDYSLSLKSAKGFMHMRIEKSDDCDKFILGQFSSPFDSIPQMIKHYSSNQLPIRGAEHMCLLQPVIAQLL